MIYFLTAAGVPLIKVGVSANPVSRLQTCQTWSPIKLRLEAWDALGDALTEAEIMHRFRAVRSHGEWFLATSELLEVVDVVRATNRTPGGWYMPDGGARGPRPPFLAKKFGLTIRDLRRIPGLQNIGQSGEHWGIAACYIPILAEHLQARGQITSYLDLFEPVAPTLRAVGGAA